MLLVVALEVDRLLVPAEFEQEITVAGDHLLQPADVGIHVGTTVRDLTHELLHISLFARPGLGRPAEGRNVMETLLLFFEAEEIAVVVNILFVAAAENEIELASGATRRVSIDLSIGRAVLLTASN